MAEHEDDRDGSEFAIHHTLGPRPGQASPGPHIHSGEDAPMIMNGVTLTGAKGGNVALANLITALSKALGFTDGTT